jgi:TatD DNase family protein
MLIDTHCHLNFSCYQADLEKVIDRAKKDDVRKIICVGSNIKDSRTAFELAKKFPGVIYPAVGIHPQKTDPKNTDSIEEQINQLKILCRKPGIVGIGECGLDFSDPPQNEEKRNTVDQMKLFQMQIEMAKEFSLPLVIHSRKAFFDTIDVMHKYSGLKGVFHCYSGGKSWIKEVAQMGFFFGVDGNITYDAGLMNVYREIPIERIILETDSPFLAPLPYRRKRNEPKNVRMVAQKIAEIKNIPLKNLISQVEKNTNELFSLC